MAIRLKVSEDLVPITELRQNSARIVSRLQRSRRPIVITQRGRSAAILESVEEYERRLDRLELLEKVARGLRAAQKGRLIDDRQAMRQLKAAAGG